MTRLTSAQSDPPSLRSLCLALSFALAVPSQCPRGAPGPLLLAPNVFRSNEAYSRQQNHISPSSFSLPFDKLSPQSSDELLSGSLSEPHLKWHCLCEAFVECVPLLWVQQVSFLSHYTLRAKVLQSTFFGASGCHKSRGLYSVPGRTK